MTADVARPEWLIPGAKVVAYTTGGAGTMRRTVVTTVDKVTSKTFTIVGDPGRFRIDRMSYETERGSVWSRTRHVVPLNSPEGQAEVVAENQRRAARRAEAACQKWRQDPTRDNRVAAIAALQAIQNEE
jgi:hypothetical protein